MGFPAEDVQPQRWSAGQVLFDDGAYSVISGDYQEEDGTSSPDLGERWNGGEDYPGFPNQGKYPT